MSGGIRLCGTVSDFVGFHENAGDCMGLCRNLFAGMFCSVWDALDLCEPISMFGACLKQK